MKKKENVVFLWAVIAVLLFSVLFVLLIAPAMKDSQSPILSASKDSYGFELVDIYGLSGHTVKVLHDKMTDNLYIVHDNKGVCPLYDAEGAIMKYDAYLQNKE